MDSPPGLTAALKALPQPGPGQVLGLLGAALELEAGGFVEGPYQARKNLMKILCRRAGVRRFGFHALRHFGALVLERANVPIGTTQRILGHESRTTT